MSVSSRWEGQVTSRGAPGDRRRYRSWESSAWSSRRPRSRPRRRPAGTGRGDAGMTGMSARWDARSAERNAGQLERVSSARARVLTMTFSSFGSIARRVGRRALYRWHRRAARARVSRPRRKTAAEDGLDGKSAADTLLTRRGSASGPRVFPARCDRPTENEIVLDKIDDCEFIRFSRNGIFFLPRGVASWQHHTLPLVASARESDGLIPREATSPPPRGATSLDDARPSFASHTRASRLAA